MGDTNMGRLARSKAFYAFLLALFCLALYLPTPFQRELHGKDELRYAEVAREMRMEKSWLVPRLGGEEYSEKPPVYFWILIVSQSLFGQTTFAMILPSILSGMLGVLFVYLFGRRFLQDRYAFLAGIILATSGLYFGLSIFLRMDMLLTVLTTAASIVFFEGYRHEDLVVKKRYYYLFYALMAMAILIKGPTGFLMPFVTALVFLMVTKRWSEFKKIQLLPGLGIVIGMLGLWALALIGSGQGEYAYHLFITQTLGRAVNSFSHKEPFYFYLREFPAIFLPWTIFLLSALVLFIKRRQELTDADYYLLCWLIAPFVLMSCFSGKLSIYLLPIFPAAALIVARLFAWATEAKANSAYLTVPGAITLILLLPLIFLLPKEVQGVPLRSLMRPVVVPYALLGLAAILTLFRKKFLWTSWLVAGMFFVLFSGLTWAVFPQVSAGYTKRPMAEELKRLRMRGASDIIGYRYYQPESLAYYSGFMVKNVPRESLVQYLDQHPDAVVLSEEKYVEDIKSQYLMTVIFSVNHDVLMKKASSR